MRRRIEESERSETHLWNILKISQKYLCKRERERVKFEFCFKKRNQPSPSDVATRVISSALNWVCKFDLVKSFFYKFSPVFILFFRLNLRRLKLWLKSTIRFPTTKFFIAPFVQRHSSNLNYFTNIRIRWKGLTIG